MDDGLPLSTGLSEPTSGEEFRDRRIALVGRFGGMNQREATNVLRSYQATVVDLDAYELAPRDRSAG